MKKVLLFLMISVLTLSSCTKDDEQFPVTCTIDGVEKNYSNVEVKDINNRLYVTAFNGPSKYDTNDRVEFRIQIINNEPTFIDLYRIADEIFSMDSSTIDFHWNYTGCNISKRILKGTFYGTLDAFEDEKPRITVTNGTFDIKY